MAAHALKKRLRLRTCETNGWSIYSSPSHFNHGQPHRTYLYKFVK